MARSYCRRRAVVIDNGGNDGLTFRAPTSCRVWVDPPYLWLAQLLSYQALESARMIVGIVILLFSEGSQVKINCLKAEFKNTYNEVC